MALFIFGPSDEEVDAATAKRIEQESRRGASEAAARHLAWAEKQYAEKPNEINKAAVETARRNMP